MAKPRNYYVLRGLRGATARQRLLDYYSGQLEVDDNVGQGPPRPASVVLYLEPFSVPLATAHVMRDSASQPAWQALSVIAPTQTHVSATLGANTSINLRSYKAPRITRITLDPTGTRTLSKITGLPYLKYDNDSLSVPFGKGTSTDTVAEVASELIAAYTDPTHKARLIPERT
ncbi:MAG: hypothetical protein WBG38_14430 [Nodosilinea sp.]